MESRLKKRSERRGSIRRDGNMSEQQDMSSDSLSISNFSNSKKKFNIS